MAADVANKITGTLPRSFNRLQSKVGEGKLDSELSSALGDLQWYRKIHEMRTEWTHYSTVFLGRTDDPEILIHGYREKSQRVELGDRHLCKMHDFIEWVRRALATTDGLAVYLLQHHVLPEFDLEQVIVNAPVRDENGWPKIYDDGRLYTRDVTVRQLLAESGLVEGRDWTPRPKAPAAT